MSDTLRRELDEARGRAGDAEERAARYEKALRALVEALGAPGVCGVINDDGSFCAAEGSCSTHPELSAALAAAREALR